MSTILTQLLTADEFYEWCHRPENRDRHFELEHGKVVELSRPGERHGVVCHNVNYLFGGYLRQRRKGRVCANDTGLVWERSPDTVRGVIDPENRSATILLPNQLPQVLEENDEITGTPVFPDLRCRVADLFFVPVP